MDSQLVICIYAVSGSVASTLLHDWWHDVETWAESLAVSPNEIVGGFRAKPERLVDGEGYNLAEYRSQFAKEVDCDNVEMLGLLSLPPEHSYKICDWRFAAQYGQDRFVDTIFLIGLDLRQLQQSTYQSAQCIACDVLHRSRPYLCGKNGFAMVMPRHFLPAGYALGIAGELPQEMVYDCTAWRRFAGKECDQLIRNVFGYNLLNKKHLDIDIGGQRLEDWVKAKSDHGRIEPLDDGLFLWTFQEGDDQEAFLHWDYPPVVAVREELKRHRVFPWQRLSGVE